MDDLEYLALMLHRLKDGRWKDGCDAGHANAVQGAAIALEILLELFLKRLQEFKRVSASSLGSVSKYPHCKRKPKRLWP